jgi:hypothetical protein
MRHVTSKIRWIARFACHVVFIVCTALHSRGARAMGIQAGADA